MKKELIPIGIVLVLGMFSSNVVGNDRLIQTSPCWGVGNTLQIWDCMAVELRQTEEDIKIEFNKLIETAKKKNVDLQSIKSDQESWVKERNRVCQEEADYLKGGTGEGLQRGDCKIRQNRDQIIDLQIKRESIEKPLEINTQNSEPGLN